MKIFISHSSKNKSFGEKLVELLRSVGVKESEIIFTSNVAYGIPIGQNIFNWLKSQIAEKPFVIYLLSDEYYHSIACLNEMGAAWIIESKHAAIFTPNFNLSSINFQNGALDPREIGFFINSEERVLSFLQLLSGDFEITTNHVIISQCVRKFIAEVGSAAPESESHKLHKSVSFQDAPSAEKEILKTEPIKPAIANKSELFQKFLEQITSGKLKDDELILLHYIIETGRFKLMTGWQEQNEIDNIKEWEQIHELKSKLSVGYASVLKRFELRGFTEVSAVTSSNNAKQIKIRDEISFHLLDLPENALNSIRECISRSQSGSVEKKESDIPMWPFG